MFYEYAFTPDVFEPEVLRDPGLFIIIDQLLAGILENGMIADLNKDRLFRHVAGRLRQADLDTDVKARIEARLECLHDRHRLVRHPKSNGDPPASVDDWLSLALQSHSRTPFDAMFLGETLLRRSENMLRRCGLTDATVVELSRALESISWAGRQRTERLRMIESEFRRVLSPVLRHARSVSLVDRFLSPGKPRFWKTIRLVAELTGSRGHGQQLEARIHIHAGDPYPESPSDRLDRWEQQLSGLNADVGAKHSYVVHLWGRCRTAAVTCTIAMC